MKDRMIDPIYAPSALKDAIEALGETEFDALQVETPLQGVVDKNPQTAVIILAGGSGERFGQEGGKQLVEIEGKPILYPLHRGFRCSG